ncbi:purine phosphoribosyltransferase family protein Apf [Leptinotarsa decemlineata]|uniref:purine phosphoribosyltransferase family protein Apf n=1 Tax=Leptinotarsa decemlineata TaxID=7539 RepID=UPI003D3056CE
MAGKIASGFVIFRKHSEKIEYLLLQTSYGIQHWTPPKGHLDPGESELKAAFRETMEESGLLKEDLKVYEDCKKVLNYEVKGKPKTVYYWLAELINPRAEVKLSDEHQDFKWLEIEEAMKYADYKDMRELLLDFEKYVKSLK